MSDDAGVSVLLFEEDSFHRQQLVRFLAVCGLDAHATSDPIAVETFCAGMNDDPERLLVMNIGEGAQLAMPVLKKVRKLPALDPERVLVMAEDGDPATVARLNTLGYLQVLERGATPEQVAKSLARILYWGAQSREDVRVFVELKAEILLPDGWTEAPLSNLSQKGALIHPAVPPEVGARLRIRIHIPGADWVTADGEVLHHVVGDPDAGDPPPRPGVGIRFTHLNESGRPSLVGFIRERLQEHYVS